MSKKLKSLNKIFDQSAKVFGIHVFGTSGVDEDKFKHAVNILREYLDNDGNGRADSKQLVKKLKREKAAMTLFSDEDELESFDEKHDRKFEKTNGRFQDLFDFEIVTSSDTSGEFDA